jgi:hypothetical protein
VKKSFELLNLLIVTTIQMIDPFHIEVIRLIDKIGDTDDEKEKENIRKTILKMYNERITNKLLNS